MAQHLVRLVTLQEMTYLRPAIQFLDEVPHGGLNHREARALGVNPTSIIDLSVNTNPLGPDPAVLDGMVSAA